MERRGVAREMGSGQQSAAAGKQSPPESALLTGIILRKNNKPTIFVNEV